MIVRRVYGREPRPTRLGGMVTMRTHGDAEHSMLCVRVPRGLHQQVKLHAIRTDQQLSAWITDALEAAMAPHRPVPGA